MMINKVNKDYLIDYITSESDITKDDVIEYRKYNYWRGFTVALIITLPIIISLMVLIDKIIKLI